MKTGRLDKLSRKDLLARLAELEKQLESQRDLQGLIESLHVHQEEVHHQQAALIEAQTELEASRDRYVELYDFAPVPILTLSSNGTIEMLNLASAGLFGVDRMTAIGTPLLVYTSADSRRTLLDHMARCRREPGLVRSELHLRNRRGEELPVEIQSRWFESGDRSPVLQTVLIDRRLREEHERIRQEEAALRAKDEAKDRFLAVLSHELRTPLTPILLTVEVLEATVADPSLKPSLEMIRRNAELQARLIDDLLDVTRIGHGKLRLEKSPVLLADTLRHVAELCEPDLRRARIRFELGLEDAGQHVSGDPTRLRQIFWNLLKNGIQHTSEGGVVRIGIEDAGAGAVRVVFSDDGIGIDSADLGRLFEPFEQASRNGRKRTGLGLGLAICRGLVEAHGGCIEAVSPGRLGGATFTVELPTCAAPAEPPAPRSGERRPKRRVSILLIEDHEDTARAMLAALAKLGFEVRLASSLEEGRRLARLPFDVLVSDVQLPDGSGLDLMRELSAAGPVKGIAISGFGSDKDVSLSQEAGFDRHLVKPVPVDRVVDAVQSLVAG
jgi:PAS domain S-box-containing protein